MKKHDLTWERAMALIEASTREEVSPELCNSPVVSVALVTYQHHGFIEMAVDGILAQKTDYPFEIVIGDDGSTDGTLETLERYRKAHPNRIRLLRAEPNLGRHTGNGRLNFIRTLRACRGKYIAVLEGDDYWTHPGKLQAQSQFLEDNPDFRFCFHNVSVLDEITGRSKLLNPSALREPVELGDMVEGYIAQTGSYFFRNDLDFFWATWFLHVSAADDIFQYAFVTGENKGKYIPETWSVYRKHPGSGSRALKRQRYKQLLGRLGALARLEDESGYDLRAEQQALLERTLPRLLLESNKRVSWRMLLNILLRQTRLRLR